jgi:hypothetical protein
MAKVGRDFFTASPGNGGVPNRAVGSTPELARVLSLPTKSPHPADIEAWSAWARKRPYNAKGEPNRLFQAQAQAFADMAQAGGLFGSIPVGNGKTLISAVAPTLLGWRRPLLLQPAALIDKTLREFGKLAEDWHVHPGIQIRSYELLGTDEGDRILNLIHPDGILCDEAHSLKDLKSARAKKLRRWMKANPATPWVLLSGTFGKDGLKDFAHMLQWALKAGAPVPMEVDELMEWCNALDHKVKLGARQPLGGLVAFSNGVHDVSAVRQGFHHRLRSTPGVVFAEPETIGASILVQEKLCEPGPNTTRAFETLRRDWETPDGWTLGSPMEVWAKARQMSLGFSYYSDPRPDDDWLCARKEWGQFVRSILSHSRLLDSEGQVKLAVQSGTLPHGVTALANWEAAWARFQPNLKAYWLDYHALEFAAKWAENHRGLVFTEHTEFAVALAQLLKVPYFGEEGLDAEGRSIEDFKGGACVASINANKQGRNLQDRWNTALVMAPMPNGLMWEQIIARLHRPGQLRDWVQFDSLVSCHEHYLALPRAIDATKAVNRDLMGGRPKLLLSDVIHISRVPNTAPFHATKRRDDGSID